MKVSAKVARLLNDDQGVSPVIGVILMVAITVILAAVIGTFVLGLGDSLNQAPQSQISVEDASADFVIDDDTPDAFAISHNGGEELTLGDLRIVLSDADASDDATFESGTWEVSDTDTLSVQKGGSDVTDSSTFAVGDQLTIKKTADSDGGSVLTEGDYDISIIHTPSESILVETTVTLQ